MRSRGWAQWALLVALTAVVTGGMALLGLPVPGLFAGLVVAAVLALLGWAPRTGAAAGRHPRPGGHRGGDRLLAQPSTLAALAADWLPVLLVERGDARRQHVAGLLLGLRPGVSPLTGMLALTAGGASGLVAITRDLGADVRVVAVVQYLRVGLVTAAMPIVAVAVFGASAPTTSGPDARRARLVRRRRLRRGSARRRAHRSPSCAGAGGRAARADGRRARARRSRARPAARWPPTLLVELAYAVIGWQAGVGFTRESLRMVIGVLPLAAALIAR